MIEKSNSIQEEKRKIRSRFKKFLRKDRIGRWEKIYARYFTISCKTKDRFLEKYVPHLLNYHPELRNNIYRYYTDLGFNRTRFSHLIGFFKSNHCSDDSSIFSTAKVFVDWQIKAGSARRQDLIELAFETVNKSLPNFIASLWLLAKYGSGEELFTLVENNITKWQHSNFLSRQVAAIVPKVRKNKVNFLKKTFTQHGQVDSLRVIENLDKLRNNQSLPRDILCYLKHGSNSVKVYPLAKFLIVVDILNDQTLDFSIRQKLRDEVIKRINDPVYIKEISCIKIDKK